MSINKHKAPDGYTWKLSSTWMGDKKIDCHYLTEDATQYNVGAVKRGKLKTYIDWDTGEVYTDRTSAMIGVEQRYI